MVKCIESDRTTECYKYKYEPNNEVDRNMDIYTISGRGGATIRKLSIESGAKISMTSKDESIFTQERLLSITGTKTACVKCLSLVLSKLAEDTETNQFINKGTNYMTNINTYDYARIGGAGGRKGGPARGRGRGDMGRGKGRGSDESPSADSTAFEDISASTTISMAVPELLIGNILGKNVCHIFSIITIYNDKYAILTISVYTCGIMMTWRDSYDCFLYGFKRTHACPMLRRCFLLSIDICSGSPKKHGRTYVIRIMLTDVSNLSFKLLLSPDTDSLITLLPLPYPFNYICHSSCPSSYPLLLFLFLPPFRSFPCFIFAYQLKRESPSAK